MRYTHPAITRRASTISAMAAARERIFSIVSCIKILAPFPRGITSGSRPGGIHPGNNAWARVPNCSHIFRPYPNHIGKAEVGTAEHNRFRPQVRRLSKTPVPFFAGGTAPTEECFQESVYETNGRPEQASRSRNGP